VVLARRWLPGLQITPRLANRATLRRITGYSIWLFLLDAATRIFYDADAVLIAAFLPVSQVTAYNLGWKPANAVSYLAGPLVGVFFPAASEMHARSAAAELRQLLVTGTRLALGLTLTGVLGLMLFGRQLLQVWVGPGHEDALPVLSLLLVVFLVSGAQNPAGVILRGMGRVRTMALAVMIEYAANIAISIFLLPRIGVAGAAIGTLVPALFNDIFFIPALACRELELPFVSFLRQAWLRPLVAAVPVLAILGPVAPGLLPASLLPLALAGAATALLYAVAFLLIAATPEERDLVRRTIRRLLNRHKGGTKHGNEYGIPSGGAKPGS
jgi:O-antigen/teichoic acid export membrane protein